MRKALGIGGKIKRKMERRKSPSKICRKNENSDKSVYWRLSALEDAFCFYIGNPDNPDKEVFIECDELVAAGSAYAERSPMSIKDVLNRLELEEVDFAGVVVGSALVLARKRLPRSKGLLLRSNNVNTNFLSDRTLNTINFLDFYEEILKPKLKTDPDESGGQGQLLREFNYGEAIIN